ncbi:hypothetical protein CPB86DRAFT_540710 [Serendipita vermifera]|nr:hypothetical protein CPB86DRAFT_540710 [Serendipita vermifera]
MLNVIITCRGPPYHWRLLAAYNHTTNDPNGRNKAWVFTGLAIRLAQIAGLQITNNGTNIQRKPTVAGEFGGNCWNLKPHKDSLWGAQDQYTQHNTTQECRRMMRMKANLLPILAF